MSVIFKLIIDNEKTETAIHGHGDELITEIAIALLENKTLRDLLAASLDYAAFVEKEENKP